MTWTHTWNSVRARTDDVRRPCLLSGDDVRLSKDHLKIDLFELNTMIRSKQIESLFEPAVILHCSRIKCRFGYFGRIVLCWARTSWRFVRRVSFLNAFPAEWQMANGDDRMLRASGRWFANYLHIQNARILSERAQKCFIFTNPALIR